MDLLNCCRFCVKEIGSSTRNDLTQDLKDKFKYLTNLDIPVSDLLSNFSCSSCVNNLMMCIEIMDEFINKQDYLRSILVQQMKKMEEKNPLELSGNTASFDGDIKIELSEIGPYVIQSAPPNNNVLYELSEETENSPENSAESQKENVDTPAELGQEEDHENDVTGEVSELETQTAKNYCKKCDMYIPSSLKYHTTKFHSNRTSRFCDYCGRSFFTRFLLAEHLRRHLNIKSYKCETCGKAFLSSKLMKHHIKSVHEKIKSKEYNQRPKMCENCGKILVNYRSYELHMMSQHDGEKSFACDVEGCSERFYFKQRLIQHKATHHEDPKYVKCPICNKTVKRLYFHMVNFHREKKFPCSIETEGKKCDKRFVSSYQLKRHVNITHRNVKPHQCEQCDASYSKLIDLDSHRNVIHLKLKIKCDLCSTLLTQKDYYRKHIISNHKELDEGARKALLEKIKKTPREQLFNVQLSPEKDD